MIRYEKDLYAPVKALFEEDGFQVKGEVKDCDLVAERDGELVICELKLRFNLKLVYQLLRRKSLSNTVYGAVVTPKRDTDDILRLIKAIDCGLIFVSEKTEIAEVVYNPSGMGSRKSQKAAKLKNEFQNRSFDNVGGCNNTRLMTVYKEQSIRLLCALELLGEAKPYKLKELGFDKNVRDILYNNYYGWFKNVKRGVYALSEKGKSALNNKEYERQVEFFHREMEDKNVQTIEK